MGLRKLELLCPAKNLEYGMAAVNHGADAVYMGASRFGARLAAGNSIQEIESMAVHAHQYHARVYVALNTILYDHELEEAQGLIRDLWNVGVDALIVQDMGILEMDLPPIALFASTQADNRTVERVQFLEASGFDRVILARELGLAQIKKIRESTRVDLEAFVHGALCVGYSGQLYWSAAIGGRSSNRGGCGQPCRLPWNLVDRAGQVLSREKHLLSLKDMNRSERLSDLADAGISSFKIEGRLKDLTYVKNVTAFYRKKLDELIQGQPLNRMKYVKASSGRTGFFFKPDPVKTFHRGKTDYFPDAGGPRGKTAIHSMDTPKFMGEKIGRVKRVLPDHLVLSGTLALGQGDGVCFLDKSGGLKGFRVNRVDHDKIFFWGRFKAETLFPGAVLFRNHDHKFIKQLSGETSDRRMGLTLEFSETLEGFCLQGRDEDGAGARVTLKTEKVPAKNLAMARANLEKQLSKLGNSLFYLENLTIRGSAWFLPVRKLNQMRRQLVEAIMEERVNIRQGLRDRPDLEPVPFPKSCLDYTSNVSNKLASRFYEKRGCKKIAPAFELLPQGSSAIEAGTVVMRSYHCIRHALGHCHETGEKSSRAKWKDPLFLENKTGRFRLKFDCRKCEMALLVDQTLARDDLAH